MLYNLIFMLISKLTTTPLKRRRLGVRSSLSMLVVLVVLASSIAFSAGQAGSVLISGRITIDGKAMERSGNIFAGEKMNTTEDGAAAITGEGTLTSVEGRTKLTYQDRYLDLECGVVQVATVVGYAVHAHGVTATPSSPQAKFEVRQGHRELTIRSLEGLLSVTDGQNPTVLKPTEFKKYSKDASCPLVVAPWVLGSIFAASTTPIWFADGQSGNPERNNISPFEP
jgi:hypothetical protein